ncbi:hypothetical protein A2U01_0094289, partial [Trifolium medium]|nr:hypothetical protein [Trifolium medium]
MTIRGKSKIVGSPMETNIRGVVKVVEEERRVVAIALSAARWGI